MGKPLNEPHISPKISPMGEGSANTPQRKRPAGYVGVSCERHGSGYRLRWIDPDTGKRRQETLPPGLTAKERERLRRDKADEIAPLKKANARRDDRRRRLDHTMCEALDHYIAVKPMTTGTRAVYLPVIESFRAWCVANRVEHARDLRKSDLRQWRSTRLVAPKLQAKAGGKRGERQASGARSMASVNRELRALTAVLNHLRADEIVRLSSDDIRAGLAREKHQHKLRDFLRADQLRALLLAAAQHDATTFVCTREGRVDVTKYKPITPLIRAAALTGMRLDELLGLQWEHVPAPGDRIYLPAEVAKGGVARVIDLSISPTALVLSEGGSVFGLTEGEVDAARKRLVSKGAPHFTWHALRRTCGTYITCSSVYGSSGVYQSARRLGHSVAVAEKHYLGVVTCDATATTLEQVLGLDGVGALERATRDWRAAVQAREVALAQGSGEVALSEDDIATEQALDELAHDLETGRRT